MIGAFSRGFSQLSDPALRRVLIIGLVGSLLIYLAIFLGAFAFVEGKGWLDSWWLGPLIRFGGTTVLAILSWLMFPAIVTLIVSFFLEPVAKAVEDRYYPGLAEPRHQQLGEILWITIKFMALAVVLNLITLPLVFILIFFPPFNFFVFYALNGYLLGREYFELVAHRRMEARGARALRGAFPVRMFLAGVIIALMMTIPVLNLIAPIVATAAMVHLVHAWRDDLAREEER